MEQWIGTPEIQTNAMSAVLDSIVVSIPACHAGDRGSIPRLGGTKTFFIDNWSNPLVQ